MTRRLLSTLGGATAGLVTSMTLAAAPAESGTFSGRAASAHLDFPALGVHAVSLADAGGIPPDGGFTGAALLSAEVPGVFGADVLHAALAGARYAGTGGRTDSSASLAEVVLLAGHFAEVRAAFVRAEAAASETGAGGRSEIEALTFSGVPIPVSGGPNQRVEVPGATLVINEQIPASGGVQGITVNALHLRLATGEEAILASAESLVDPTGEVILAEAVSPTMARPEPVRIASTLSPDLLERYLRGGTLRFVQGSSVCFDSVSGSGWFAPTPAGPKRASFGFDVGRTSGGALKGRMSYVDRNTGMRVKATVLTRYEKTGENSRAFEGNAEVGGASGFTFVVEVFDDRSGGNDRFRIALSNGYSADSGGSGHATDGAGIDGGDIKLQDPCPPADTAAPSVAITSPSNGSTVSGTITTTADATDDVGVAGVQFLVDGAAIGAEDTTAPFSAEWDTTTAADGSHTITAVARDAAGNTATSAPVTVTVSNGAAETGGIIPSGTRFEEDSSAITYVAADLWYYRFSPGFSQGRVNASPHAGQRATLTFKGTGADWVGYRASNTGIARVYLDGKAVADVDTFAPVPIFQPVLYSVRGLPSDSHTLTIEVTGTYSTPIGSAWIAIDAFDVVQ